MDGHTSCPELETVGLLSPGYAGERGQVLKDNATHPRSVDN